MCVHSGVNAACIYPRMPVATKSRGLNLPPQSSAALHMNYNKPRKHFESEGEGFKLLKLVSDLSAATGCHSFAGYVETSEPFGVVYTAHGLFSGLETSTRSLCLEHFAAACPPEYRENLTWYTVCVSSTKTLAKGETVRSKRVQELVSKVQQASDSLQQQHGGLQFWVYIFDRTEGTYAYGTNRDVLLGAEWCRAAADARCEQTLSACGMHACMHVCIHAQAHSHSKAHSAADLQKLRPERVLCLPFSQVRFWYGWVGHPFTNSRKKSGVYVLLH